TGAVTVSIPDLPAGVTLGAVEFADGFNEAMLRLDATESVKSFNQSVKLVAKGLSFERTAEFRLIVEAKPSLKLRPRANTLTLRLNQTTKERVALDRENCRDKTVKLRLDEASRSAFRDIFEEEPPTELAGGKDEFFLVLRPKKSTGPLKMQIEVYLES